MQKHHYLFSVYGHYGSYLETSNKGDLAHWLELCATKLKSGNDQAFTVGALEQEHAQLSFESLWVKKKRIHIMNINITIPKCHLCFGA